MIAANESSQARRRDFQRLKTQLHRRIVDSIDMSKAGELGDAEFRNQLEALVGHVCDQPDAGLATADRESMARELMDEIYRFGPLQPLMEDPDISDVLVNGSDTVIVERNGVLEQTDVTFADDAHLLHFIQRLVGRAGRRVVEGIAADLTPLVKLQDRPAASVEDLTGEGFFRFGQWLKTEDFVQCGPVFAAHRDAPIAGAFSRISQRQLTLVLRQDDDIRLLLRELEREGILSAADRRRTGGALIQRQHFDAVEQSHCQAPGLFLVPI